MDSELLSCQCLCETLGACGIDLSVSEALQLFLGRSATAVGRYYGERGQPIPENFRDELNRRVSDSFMRSLEPIPGIASLLSNLETAFCVASSSDLERVSLSLKLTGLGSYFGNRLYTAQMVTHSKPAPDLFLHAAGQMHVAPQNTLVVEDSVSGVVAAKAAGMTVWGFVGGSHYRTCDGRSMLSEAGADRVFECMAEF